MNNIITAVFEVLPSTRTRPVWQYSYGQILRIQGLQLPSAVEIHFALEEKSGDSVTRIGVTRDNVTDVPIPDSMLENDNIGEDYKIYVFVFLSDDDSGETVRKITIPVTARSKPEAHETSEEAELFREAIKAVNESAEKAENAKDAAEKVAGEADASNKEAQAAAKKVADDAAAVEKNLLLAKSASKESKAWAIGDADVPETVDNNAKFYSEAAKQVAAKNGFCHLGIDDNGHLILDRTNNIKDELDFEVNEKGHLEVLIN